MIFENHLRTEEKVSSIPKILKFIADISMIKGLSITFACEFFKFLLTDM